MEGIRLAVRTMHDLKPSLVEVQVIDPKTQDMDKARADRGCYTADKK